MFGHIFTPTAAAPADKPWKCLTKLRDDWITVTVMKEMEYEWKHVLFFFWGLFAPLFTPRIINLLFQRNRNRICPCMLIEWVVTPLQTVEVSNMTFNPVWQTFQMTAHWRLCLLYKKIETTTCDWILETQMWTSKKRVWIKFFATFFFFFFCNNCQTDMMSNLKTENAAGHHNFFASSQAGWTYTKSIFSIALSPVLGITMLKKITTRSTLLENLGRFPVMDLVYSTVAAELLWFKIQ